MDIQGRNILRALYTVRNIKISLLITNASTSEVRSKIAALYDCLTTSASLVCESKNFFIYKDPTTHYVYTFFYTGHINVTRLLTELSIQSAILAVVHLLHLDPSIIVTPRTDNITVSGSFPCSGNRCKKFESVVLTKRPNIFRKQHYNNTVFPNAFLSPQVGGTFILSRKLNYSLVGCKSLSNVERALESLSYALTLRQ